MDYEKNKEALAVVKQMVSDGQISQEVAEKYFPKLKKSEDERIKNLIYCLIRDRSDNGKLLENNGCTVEKALAWLEKQGQTFTKKDIDDAYLKGVCDAKHELKKQNEQKPTWSEEDNKRKQSIISSLNYCKEQYPDKKEYEKDINWINSLRPQPHWKPSEEQFELLKHIMENVPLSYRDKSEVGDLYLDLKRLREE